MMISKELAEKVTRRADQIAEAGGTDIAVTICAWTADTKIVAIEWFNGHDPQREIVGSLPSADGLKAAPQAIQLGDFMVTGARSLSTAFKAVQQARTDNKPVWCGTVDDVPVTVEPYSAVESESSAADTPSVPVGFQQQ